MTRQQSEASGFAVLSKRLRKTRGQDPTRRNLQILTVCKSRSPQPPPSLLVQVPHKAKALEQEHFSPPCKLSIPGESVGSKARPIEVSFWARSVGCRSPTDQSPQASAGSKQPQLPWGTHLDLPSVPCSGPALGRMKAGPVYKTHNCTTMRPVG